MTWTHSSGSSLSSAINAADYFSQYLTNSGSSDMGVDGSSSPVTFSAAPATGRDLEVARLLLYMEAGTNFASNLFMNLTALTNAVLIQASGVGIAEWQDNVDVLLDMFDLSNAGTAFSNERRSLSGRWTFTKGTGREPILVKNGETFDCIIRDDLSAAGIIFKIKIQGQLVG